MAALTAKFQDRVDVRLFHTPELHGWRKRIVPRRFDEGWGLQHMKCYGFDDTVIMSGYVGIAFGKSELTKELSQRKSQL